MANMAAHAAHDGVALDQVPLPHVALRTGLHELAAELASTGATADDQEAAASESDNTLVRMINALITEAVRLRASDIHVETAPPPKPVRVRLRVDGELVPCLELPSRLRFAMVARLKIMAELDISEHRKPQDGKIAFARFGGPKVELRVVTVPTHGGMEDVVLRLLSGLKPMPIGEIGLADANLAALREVIAKPYGLVLICGPTGCGKTTTLHSVMRELNTDQRKIWTAEDPVEIEQEGLRQVQVNPRIGWTFAAAMRTFLRADPDVVMIGEMRDEETARIAVEASLTGHLVLSTLHTNSAPESITRLLEIGLDPFMFSDSLLAILAQRLVRCARIAALPSRCPTKRCTRWPASTALSANGHGPSAEETVARWRAAFCRRARPRARVAPRRLRALRAPRLPRAARAARTGCAPTKPCAKASATTCRRPNCKPRRWPRACARCARTASRRCCKASPTCPRSSRPPTNEHCCSGRAPIPPPHRSFRGAAPAPCGGAAVGFRATVLPAMSSAAEPPGSPLSAAAAPAALRRGPAATAMATATAPLAHRRCRCWPPWASASPQWPRVRSLRPTRPPLIWRGSKRLQLQELAHVVARCAAAQAGELSTSARHSCRPWPNGAAEAPWRRTARSGRCLLMHASGALGALRPGCTSTRCRQGCAVRMQIELPADGGGVRLVAAVSSEPASQSPARDTLAWQVLQWLTRALGLHAERETAPRGERVVVALPRG
ncbi:MAG: GspE/PulE family protein [Rubrivivax sp.]